MNCSIDWAIRVNGMDHWHACEPNTNVICGTPHGARVVGADDIFQQQSISSKNRQGDWSLYAHIGEMATSFVA